MRPGQTVIRECSVCEKCIKQHTSASGNTFGARFWTDGKLDAPMLPDQPLLVKCPHCGALVWIEKQKYLGPEPIDTSWYPSDQFSGKRSWIGKLNRVRAESQDASERDTDRFKEAESALIPTAQEYIGFLKGDKLEPQDERYVRLRAWWAGNDARRTPFQTTTLTPFEEDNLRAFLPLLNEADDEDRLMKAEVFRELSMFADSERLLATHFEDNLAQAVAFIRDLNRKRNSTVQEMSFR